MQKKEIYQEISKVSNSLVEYFQMKEDAERSNLELMNKEKFELLPSQILEKLENDVNEMVIRQVSETITKQEMIFKNLIKELKKM